MSTARDAAKHYDELLTGAHWSELVERIERFLPRNPLLFDRGNVRVRPFFIEDVQYRKVQEAAETVARSLVAIADRCVNSFELRRELALPMGMMEFAMGIDGEKGQPTQIGRLDGYLDADGHAQFIELNTAAGGIGEMQLVEELLLDTALSRTFSQRFAFRPQRLMEEAVEQLIVSHERRTGAGLPTVAVVCADADIRVGARGSGVWLCHGASRGLRVLRAEPADFEYRDGALMLGDERVDIVAWMVQHLGDPSNASALLDAVRQGAVRDMFGVSRSAVAGLKLAFAWMSDPAFEDTFGDCIEAEARAHIPWTRIIDDVDTPFEDRTASLPQIIADERQRMVIKPAAGKLGHGVLLGWECGDEAWQKALEGALENKRAGKMPSIVQQRVHETWDTYPVYRKGELVFEKRASDLNPYLWDGVHAGGAVVRFNEGDSLELSGPGALVPMWRLL